MAVSLAREAAEQPQHHTVLEPEKNEDEEAIEVGDFVALVEPQSTLQKTKDFACASASLASKQNGSPAVVLGTWRRKSVQLTPGLYVLARIFGLAYTS